jgi:hypothetical protein
MPVAMKDARLHGRTSLRKKRAHGPFFVLLLVLFLVACRLLWVIACANGQADSRGTPRLAKDGRVHTDQPAATIEQGAAGIAGINAN